MNTTKLTQKFEAALIYATRLHANQTRKVGGVPYISHLMSVAALVLEAGGNEDEAIAALLHDAVEDQGGKTIRDEIHREFGNIVVTIVDGCTESDIKPKPPWLERKTRFLDQLRHASPSVRLVSLADKLHNARSILSELQQQGDVIWSNFNSSKENIFWYYRSLLKVYQETGSDWMTEEFARVVSQLCNEQYSTLVKITE